METKITYRLTSSEIKRDIYLDSVEFKNNKKRKDFNDDNYYNIKNEKI